jgi:disulfide bond formation protein DsbB
MARSYERRVWGRKYMSNGDRSAFWTPRFVFAVIFLICAGLVSFALYLQHAHGLEPCPMCILQRYAFIAIGIVALIASLHNPLGFAVNVYSSVIVLLALGGSGVAIRHSWLQHFPTPSFSCGADLGYLLNTFPLAKALPAIFEGTGECSKVDWKLLGLSIPEWALAWFVLLGISTVILVARVRRQHPNAI